MTAPCPDCGGPMRGVAFVDGVRDGIPWGEAVPVCAPCEIANAPSPTPFGMRLRRTRFEMDMSLREAGDALGIGFVRVSHIEQGRELASCELARQWAEIVGADPEEYAALARESLGVGT